MPWRWAARKSRAFAFVAKRVDKTIALAPSAPFAILNLGGLVSRTSAPDIEFSGWNVTIGDDRIATWGDGSIPAIRLGKAGLKIRASGPGKATLAVLFETPRANVESIRIFKATLAAK